MRIIATATLMLAAPVLVSAQDMAAMQRSNPLQVQQTQNVGTVIHSSQIDRTQWSLTEEDWDRYDEIMRGPRRFWSPNMDPITLLGAHARSDAERQRYAEMLMEQERKRTEGELALMRAYSEAWVRHYGNEELLDGGRLGIEQVIPFEIHDRITIFLDSSCVACTDIVTAVADYLKTTAWPGMDLYFVGDEEDAIQQWMISTNIPLEMVESGRITVNFNDGILERLQGTALGLRPDYPMAYRRRGDEFSPVEMSYLLRRDLYPAGGAPQQQADSSGGLFDRIRGMFK